ncbi:hypothetical protein DFH27DRAFT_537265 [Peziza echinospora]|nr:hypothetical protein DFH27DRAFT_537265 [Peziza echinospora]
MTFMFLLSSFLHRYLELASTSRAIPSSRMPRALVATTMIMILPFFNICRLSTTQTLASDSGHATSPPLASLPQTEVEVRLPHSPTHHHPLWQFDLPPLSRVLRGGLRYLSR